MDGWQSERLLNRGSEVLISATQGFGTNRKFNRWVEFSESQQQLRTARVQSPFNLRTALLVEEDMTLFAHYNFTFAGTAVNGYLSGAEVFLDFNLNGQLDDGEPFGFSTENGGFEMEVSEEVIQLNDRNGNGSIDPEEGMLVVSGGMDQASNLPLSVIYRAPPNYTVITAVSTVVAELVEAGRPLDEAEDIVAKYLSLPENIEFSSFEPLREVFYMEEEAQDFILRATQLANLFSEGSRFLEMTTANKVDRAMGSEIIVSALKDQILEKVDATSYIEIEKIDLTK